MYFIIIIFFLRLISISLVVYVNEREKYLLKIQFKSLLPKNEKRINQFRQIMNLKARKTRTLIAPTQNYNISRLVGMRFM